MAAETTSGEANSRTKSATPPEGLSASATVDGPTGEVHQEGVVASQGATQANDVDEGEAFDPNQFWLLLAQAGYKTW